jgi:type VI secretion system secreted protein Hcp
MNDVIVTSVIEVDDGSDTQVETVTLGFAKVNVEYKPQKADGSLAAGIQFKYDLQTNK